MKASVSSRFAGLGEALGRLQVSVRAVLLRGASGLRRERPGELQRLLRGSRPRRFGMKTIVAAAIGAVVLSTCGLVWWRLGNGPVSIDIATPWLTAALQERLGGNHRLDVGGTQIERDETGRAALRLRDVVVRDAGGVVVANAPKAEVGIAALSLFTGSPRAERVSLIGAEMAVRIERDGHLTVFAGSDTRPLPVPLPAAAAPVRADAASQPSQRTAAAEPSLLAAAMGWLQDLDAVGFDGGNLIEIGLKNGSIAVDDRRNGKQLTFANINLSLTRPKEGGAALALTSMGSDGPWSLNATVVPRPEGRRAIDAVIRDVSPKDILLALRIGGGEIEADVPLSAAIRAEVGADGTPHMLEGRIFAGAGHIGNIKDPGSRILLDEGQMELHWDAANRILAVPLDLQLGANRITFAGQLAPPPETGGAWVFGIGQGQILLASQERTRAPPLVIDRVAVRAIVDTERKRLTLQQGDLRGAAGGVAMSGTFDFAGEGAHVNFGIAGTRMTVQTLKRLWPAFIAPPVRSWIDENVQAGAIERLDIAANTPAYSMVPQGPALANDALSVDIVASGVTVRPLVGLPPVRDADIVARVTGRTATVNLGRGSMELPSSKKLNVSSVLFEVPDTRLKDAPARARFRVDGAAESAAELIAMDALRDAAAFPIEPAGVRGAFTGQVSVGFPLSKELPKSAVQYAIETELTGFSADKFIRGQKAEAALLKVSANQNIVQVKGDMRIAGVPAVVDFRKAQGDTDAEVRIQATLDDGARTKLGFDVGNALTGPVPIKLSGRTNISERDGRLTVEADLTPARVNDLLPGWTKSPGRPARATFAMIDKGQTTRFEDLILEGGGGISVKGSLEVDGRGEIQQANLPTFALSDGDKASLKAERNSDGTLKVLLRGDLYDGRGLAKSTVSNQKSDPKARQTAGDIDLEVKLGAMTGYHGEALRNLDLRMSRRAGHIRSFSMTGRLGQDATIAGDLRGRGGGRQVVYLETNDAGALFRFTDIYPRVVGGALTVAMDAPTPDSAPQEGLLNVRDFGVRGEQALERVAATSTSGDGSERTYRRGGDPGVNFSRMRVEFTRSPGKLVMREGVVWGPSIGATVEGQLDYARDQVSLRGTLVPAYALNNMFGRLPVIGMLLGGGQNEGLLGITYQVIGSPQAPVMQVNPMSAVAPGFLRKLFEFRGAEQAQPFEQAR